MANEPTIELEVKRIKNGRGDSNLLIVTEDAIPDVFIGRIVWIDKEDRSAAKRFVMMSGVDRVGIEMNGNIWADIDLGNYKFNPNVITHYLLQQHFDLFGLIDAGLAIDTKTLNQ